MERKHIQAKVHPKVLMQMKCIRDMFKHEGWGGVIEEMAKMIWDKQFGWLTPGKYERDTEETEINWHGTEEKKK